jgi:alkanesulfonate monooxygenase SsuD/methylene tetrahydromethanopterin reductase-like flavin-dependent oxidoreductase (luciferase family)
MISKTRQIPDEWVDAFSAAGTPEQVVEALQRWVAAGVDSVVFQSLNGDPDCLDEYTRYLMPLLKPKG